VLWRAGILALGMAGMAWGGMTEQAYVGVDAGLLTQVRMGFETAPDSAAATQSLLTRLDDRLPPDPADWPPVFRAYRAALEGLTGKHSARPWTKYRRTKSALAMWDGLVEAHPESVEMRMLRYSFASQLPDFFDQQPRAAADLTILTDLLERAEDPHVTETFRQDSIRWILRNGGPTPGQRRRLEALLDDLE
jgi:hypothetical protein